VVTDRSAAQAELGRRNGAGTEEGRTGQQQAAHPEAAKDIDELTREKTGMTFLTAQMNPDLLTETPKKKRSLKIAPLP
jgi:hypothetical protein